MYKEITKANRKLQEARISSRRWTKGDILAFGKMLNSYRFSSDKRKDDINIIACELNKTVRTNGGYSITSEQSEFGIEWLKSRILTSKGKLSKSKFAEDFRECDAEVIRNFEKFGFMGFYENENGWSSHYTPIYRTISNDGTFFDYTMFGGQWGRPGIVGRGKVTPKLEKVLA